MSRFVTARRTIAALAVLGVLCVLLGLGRGSAPETVRASPVDTLGAVPAADAGIVILTNSERSWPLFARVLDEWTRGSGLGRVGMHWISTASTGLLALVALLGGTTLWMGVRLVAGLRAGRRRWAPLSRVAWARRLVQAGVGLGVLGGLAWSAAQPYLFVTSIAPSMAGWAGWALLLWATLLVGAALCPRTGR